MEIGLPLDHRETLHIVYYNKDSVSLPEQKLGKFYSLRLEFLSCDRAPLYRQNPSSPLHIKPMGISGEGESMQI